MTEFKWHREVVTPSTYLKEDKNNLDKSKDYSLEEKSVSNGEKKIVLSEDLISIISKSKSEKAYEAASDVRKFEIGLFWQRAAYFWAFITVVYAAYFKVLTEIYEKQHGDLPLIILSLLGLFFSFSWFLTSKASKHWQENWELHLDLLEDEVTGPLYKTYLAEKSYSVSKVNIYAGFIVSVCSFGLLIYEFAIFEKKYLHVTGWLGILVCFLFAIIVLFGLYTYAMFSIGNKKTLGQDAMQRKVYEKISNKRFQIKEINKNRKDYSLVIFFILILIFTVICFILKFGDVNMNSEKIKNGIFLGICFIVAVPIIYFVFVGDKHENSYSNTLEVSDSGITLVYTGDDRKAKICLIKYIDESELNDQKLELGDKDIIYISTDTPIDKSFFESLKDYDYKIKFPKTNAVIEISKNKTEEK